MDQMKAYRVVAEKHKDHEFIIAAKSRNQAKARLVKAGKALGIDIAYTDEMSVRTMTMARRWANSPEAEASPVADRGMVETWNKQNPRQ